MQTIEEGITKIVDDHYEYLNEQERAGLVHSTMRRLAFRIARGYRKCATCQKDKQPVEFSQDRRSADGLASRCKPCERQRYRDRSANQENV